MGSDRDREADSINEAASGQSRIRAALVGDPGHGDGHGRLRGNGYVAAGRAREKQALIEAFDRGQQTSVDLGSGTVDALRRYQHVTIRGHYDPSHQVLIDNMPSSAGQAGYRVLTPFVRPGSAKLLLVDRGWLPLGLSRARLPGVSVTGEPRETGGRLDQLPVPGVRIGTADVPATRAGRACCSSPGSPISNER